MASPHPFRFAVQGGPFRDPSELADHARHVEALGYDELYTADHIGGIDPSPRRMTCTRSAYSTSVWICRRATTSTTSPTHR